MPNNEKASPKRMRFSFEPLGGLEPPIFSFEPLAGLEPALFVSSALSLAFVE
jgi:hypothetical protein